MARAEKHKTKYKESSIKDFKKSQKQEARKDLKDYTAEDKDGGMNPNSVGEPQTNVLRKRDKLVIDDVDNMVPNKKDVADYYKVEGDHDPKYTAKKRKEIQNEDEKDSKDQIEDKIENLKREQLEKKISKLTTNQKERLVREYIRRKIAKVLTEQLALKELDEQDDEAPEEETPISDEPVTDPTTPATPEAPVTDPTTPATPEAPVTDPPTPTAETPIDAPAAETLPTLPATEIPTKTTSAPEVELTPKTPKEHTIAAIDSQKGAINKAKFIAMAYTKAMKDADPKDFKNGARLLARTILKNSLKQKSNKS